MNLGTTVACLSSKSRNIYSINNQTHPTSSATTTTPPVINKNRPGGRLSQKSSANSSTKSQQKKPKKLLESIKEGHQQQQHVLYSANSYQDCPCDHHRLARLREESSQENYVDLVTASFEASLAPLRGLLTPSISTGDSGVNTNSNGSRRSSGRAVRERTFSSSSSTSSSSSPSLSCGGSELDDAAIGCVTTTVIVEHNGCEDSRNEVWQRNSNRIITNTKSTSITTSTQQRRDLIQISPENDPSQNWTLIKPLPLLNNTNDAGDCCDHDEEADSLFSSLKTSHSSSLKALTCTCPQDLPALDVDNVDEHHQPPSLPFPSTTTHSTLRRVASYPRCHPNLDPHRFSLFFDGSISTSRTLIEQQPQNILHSLRQLPTVPPSDGEGLVLPGPNNQYLHLLRRPLTHFSSTQDFVIPKHRQQSSCSTSHNNNNNNSSSQHHPLRRLQHRNASFPVFNGLIEVASVVSKSAVALDAATVSSAAEVGHGQHDIPPCVRNVIMHQIKSPRPKKSNATKMIKKLSKTITLPEDPNDPTAFTLHLDQYDHYSLMRRQQKKNTTGTSSNLVKIVGSFSIFMTIAIVITVLCFLYWSDTFKPMTMM